MFLIFLSWIYILFSSINLGFILDKIIKTKNTDFVITAIFGLFTTTILASFWAIFGRINIEFHLFLLLLNIIISLCFNQEIIVIYRSFYIQLKELNKSLLIFLLSILILMIAQCASSPFIIDNESYYIQTIKWLNGYGFVKGLVNLHYFLGQTSGWHITQSAFSFSFLYKNFNDLSGFCLLLGNLFSILKLNEYYKNSNKNYLIIGLLPILNLFFFQFISSPSPDLPVYIFSFILFFYFLEYYKNSTIEVFTIITILVIFTIYIKVTSVALLLFPLLILIKNFQKLRRRLLMCALILTVIFVLFLIKNTIITGFPLYPLQLFEISGLDYAIPKNIIAFLFYQNDTIAINSLSNFQMIKNLFFQSVIDSFFNLLTIITVIISPFFIHTFYNKKAVWIPYFITIIELVLIFKISPQYRYFIHFILFLDLIIISTLINKTKYITTLLNFSLIIIAVFIFLPINYNLITNNKLISKNSHFKLENLIFPHSNAKIKTKYIRYQKGNLIYNSPIENDFFWGNGDGNLPCINKKQIDYFEKYFHIIPQMRTNNLKDGFYSKKAISNE